VLLVSVLLLAAPSPQVPELPETSLIFAHPLLNETASHPVFRLTQVPIIDRLLAASLSAPGAFFSGVRSGEFLFTTVLNVRTY